MHKTRALKIPKDLQKAYHNIFEIIQQFCKEHMNEEYEVLCGQLLAKLARKSRINRKTI